MNSPHSTIGERCEQVFHSKSADASVTLRPLKILPPREIRRLVHLLKGNALANLARQEFQSLNTLYSRKYALYRKPGIESDITLYRERLPDRLLAWRHSANPR